MTTAEQLAAAEAAHQAALGHADHLRHERDQLIRKALGEGWGVRQISRATGLTPARITQIRQNSR